VNPLLRVEDLAIGWHGRPVAAGIGFAVGEGDWWCVVGKNGSGKTTLLKTLLGELAPLAGRIASEPDVASRRRLAFVPQQQTLRPSLPTTVFEFVATGLVDLGLGRAARRARVARALARVGFGARAAQSFWTLSGGERQRAFVARALAREPLLLLLDEPTSGLDPDGREQFAQDLEGMRKEGVAIWMITHDLVLAQRHATHWLELRSGRAEASPA
jgi:ABC-type Mn2+/Zn2+ transport system ATPase subunit